MLNKLNKPTIACVQGAAYGSAIGLLACCDIAIAARDATFCFPKCGSAWFLQSLALTFSQRSVSATRAAIS
ncbi:MAG: hypothetical protein H7X91_08630 [Burkholderiales bacterium]|nr:hypothetical protein [Burkholderiales bacterium]